MYIYIYIEAHAPYIFFFHKKITGIKEERRTFVKCYTLKRKCAQINEFK